MNLDKSKWKIKASLIVLGVLALAVGTRVSAASSFWDDVSTKLAHLLVVKVSDPVSEPVREVESVLGSAQTSPSHLTDTGTLNNQGSLYLWDTQTGGGLEVAGAAYFNSAITLYTGITNNGTSTLGTTQTYDVDGSFADATTTLACAPNPFGVTSTARYSAFSYTGIATTSFAVVVATSTRTTGLTTSTPGFTATSPTQLLAVNLLLKTTATGTRFMGSSVIDNRSSQGTATVGSFNVAPTESVCFVAGEGNGGSTTGITNPTNLFAGTYDVEFKL